MMHALKECTACVICATFQWIEDLERRQRCLDVQVVRLEWCGPGAQVGEPASVDGWVLSPWHMGSLQALTGEQLCCSSAWVKPVGGFSW